MGRYLRETQVTQVADCWLPAYLRFDLLSVSNQSGSSSFWRTRYWYCITHALLTMVAEERKLEATTQASDMFSLSRGEQLPPDTRCIETPYCGCVKLRPMETRTSCKAL